ncbi:hypothetical protein RI129_004946 [Pyrocoelia pectoralis]|uniref:PHD-type domain-containing protein n=1 Tax=Pyrocoelia pectoralis TaxID=417401 RepID=A0AAN7VEV8_9COLE
MACIKCLNEFKRNDKYLTCNGWCDGNYHIKCVNISESGHKFIIECPNILWCCDKCCSMKKLGLKAALGSIIESVKICSEKIEGCKEAINQQTGSIAEVMNENQGKIECSISHLSETKSVSYADKLKLKKHEPVLIIKPKKQEQNSMETKAEIKKSIDPTNLDVSGLRSIRNGGVLIECNNEDTMNKVKETVESKLGPTYEVKIPRKKLPRVKIVGITEKLLPEKIEEKVKLQNHNLNMDQAFIKVVHIKENKKRRGYIAYAEVNALAYRIMMKEERVNIGWDSCRVYDAVEITRCFTCSGFNHKSSECKCNKACPKCAGPHLVSECSAGEDNLKCVNCIETMDKLKIKLDVRHPAWSHDCPVFKRKLDHERSKINFLE